MYKELFPIIFFVSFNIIILIRLILYLKPKPSVCRMGRKLCFGNNSKFKKLLLNEYIEIDKLMKSRKIQGFLSSGTILGYVRHNDFIPNDDDISIGIYANERNIEETYKIFKERGYSSKRYLCYVNGKKVTGQFTFKKRIEDYIMEFDVEPFYYDKESKKLVSMTFWKPMAYYIFDYFSLKEVDFLNHKFYIPDNPRRFVEELFGKEWHIEKPYFHNTEYGNRVTKYNTKTLGYFNH